MELEEKNQEREQHKGIMPNRTASGIKRKSLPQNTRQEVKDHQRPQHEFNPYFQDYSLSHRGANQLGRKPVGGSSHVPSVAVERAPALPPRQPLGPRSMHQRFHSTQAPPFVDRSIPEPSGRENTQPRRWSEQPPISTRPVLPQRPGKETTGNSSYLNAVAPARQIVGDHDERLARGLTPPISSQYSCDTRNSLSSESQRSDFSITLIRRDPASGSQWNAGKIRNSPDNEALGEIRKSLSIELSTPGYSKFMDDSLSESVSQNPSVPRERASMDDSSQAGDQFRRQIFTTRPRSLDLRDSSRDSILRPRFDSRRSSEYSTASISQSSNDFNSPKPSTHRAFSFLSPWNGVCEFSTGVTGRSLKCKHTLPSDLSRRASQQTIVSELRFNLPASKTLARPSSKLPMGDKGNRRSFFSTSKAKGLSLSGNSVPTLNSHFHSQNFTNSPFPSPRSDFQNDHHGDDFDLEAENGMDLSLGRERAGGGFGGKQAKLGKLVVEKDGLMMLDLVVAANMGIWWGVYEKGNSE